MPKGAGMGVAEQELRALRRARVRKELAELEYHRQLVVAVARTSQRQVAAELGLSQPSVSSALRAARRVPVPREGQRSASPYEVCQRYAAGELDREEAVAQLVAWPYVPAGEMRTSPGDDLMVVPEGTVQDLFRAERAGLIDVGMCEAVLDALYGDA
ncbi:LysR family transcriptional regulator [Actinomyces sp. 2119]|nr:LysR family transcriptional regulator [Actinomyces sp. 2119]